MNDLQMKHSINDFPLVVILLNLTEVSVNLSRQSNGHPITHRWRQVKKRTVATIQVVHPIIMSRRFRSLSVLISAIGCFIGALDIIHCAKVPTGAFKGGFCE